MIRTLARMRTSGFRTIAVSTAFFMLGAYVLARAIAAGAGRAAITAVLIVLLGGLAVRAPRVGIIATMVYLALLGDFRRVLIGLVGWPTQDPLLLVGPAVVALLALPEFTRPATPRGRLRGLVLALLAIMVLEMFNPLQGGLAVGVAGALFYVAPLLWFFVGRRYGGTEFTKLILFRVLPLIALAAAALGIYQAFFGWLPFERRWLDVAGYTALHVGSRIRPISFFTSSAEYETFVAAVAIVLVAGAFKGRWWSLPVAALLAVGAFLGGSRGVVVKGAFTIALLWAMLGRLPATWVPRLLVALAVAVGGGYWALNQLAAVSSGPTASLVQHQTEGLLHPLNTGASTARIHASMFVNGFTSVVKSPLGRGLGATTLAAHRFGGAGFSTEVDLTDVIASLGLVGGVLYLAVILSVIYVAVRYWRTTSAPHALAILGFLVLTLGSWLIGGQYAMSALTWLLIGALDRHAMDAKP